MDQYLGSGLKLPLWDRIEAAESILLAGCGGGFDFLHCLPLYFKLIGMRKTVHISNLSFSQMKASTARVLVRGNDLAQGPVLYEVTADSEYTASGTPLDAYFPEKYLCDWFRTALHSDLTVYTFIKKGISSTADAYRFLISQFHLDLIILVDGGSDSLMAGDEFQLGTPAEDMTSMFAVLETGCRGILLCLGVGADRFHGVSDCSTLRAIAELTAAGGFLGAFSLLKGMPEVEGYLTASAYIQSRMPSFQSIVNYYITSSLEGRFGNYNTNPRTAETHLFVNPLMSQYYAFDLTPVTDRVKYKSFITGTKTMADLFAGIEYYRNNYPIKAEHEEIPRTHEF